MARRRPVTLTLLGGALAVVALLGAIPASPASTASVSESPERAATTGRGAGPHAITWVRAVAARSISSACGGTSVPLVDVPESHTHHAGISCLYLWQVAAGTSPGRYSPDQAVSRGQMATFIARTIAQTGLTLPTDPPAAFVDVPPASTHALSINQLAQLGVVGGNAGRYRPDRPVNRAQMASFLARAAQIVAGTQLPGGADAFTDDSGDPHEENINRMAGVGVATGASPTTYQPAANVTRGQMGSFLARLLALLVDAYGIQAPVPEEPIRGPLYRFLQIGRTQPARWDPCAAPFIPWQLVGPADPAWVDVVTAAFAEAARYSGIDIRRVQGTTDPRRIDVSYPGQSRFPPGAVGLAITEGHRTSTWELELDYAELLLNADFYASMMRPGAGVLDREAANIVAMHEVAHVLGLDHVDDERLLMAPNLDPTVQDPVYGTGEQIGLSLVGAPQGCLP